MERWVCDTVPSTRFPLYTRANVGEVFPDPVFPFTRTVALHSGAEMGWRDAWVRMGAFDEDEFRPDDMDVLGVSGGYCYRSVLFLVIIKMAAFTTCCYMFP